jgi:uncharacterized protein YciI
MEDMMVQLFFTLRRLSLTLLLAAAVWGLTSLPARADEAPMAEAEAGPQMFVAVLRLDHHGPPGSPEEGEALVSHIAYLNELFDQGVLMLAGPYMDESGEGICVIEAASEEEAVAVVSADPTVKAGLMTVVAVHPFWAAFNSATGERFTVEDMMQMMEAPAPGEPVAEGAN